MKAVAALWLTTGMAAAAPELPVPGQPSAEETLAAASVPMPITAVDGLSDVPRVEGRVTRRAWRRAQGSQTPLQLLAPVRAALERSGYEIVYDCVDVTCGGFDFRYALDLLPAPDMMVDLGNFHYVAARNGDAWVQILTSRTASAGFVHVVTVDPLQDGQTAVTAVASDAPVAGTSLPSVPQTRREEPSNTGGVVDQLRQRGSTRLSDVAFASGSSQLLDGPLPSLEALAAFLTESPDSRVLLVGHTDAVGSLAANQALSLRRAQAVVARLRDMGVPNSQLEAAGAGYLAPLAPSTTEDGRALNRRVEAVLLDTQ